MQQRVLRAQTKVFDLLSPPPANGRHRIIVQGPKLSAQSESQIIQSHNL